MNNELETAWKWRSACGELSEEGAGRVFHGPGESQGELESLSVDRFGDHFWITQWKPLERNRLNEVVAFYRTLGAQSVVCMERSERGEKTPEESRIVFGDPPADGFVVQEGPLRFRIRFRGVRHPGLFLDHAPLRAWLMSHARDRRVLNTFAYTGSLSVAAGMGGADEVTTLDLARPVVQWAEENWKINAPVSPSRFIAGDVFEWLPRLKREGRSFDCIILDPPSFSRGKKGAFSTAKDLKKLHGIALGLLEKDGILVTSINSAGVSRKAYLADVLGAAREQEISLRVLREIDLPDTFPTRADRPDDRYLKGWIFTRI